MSICVGKLSCGVRCSEYFMATMQNAPGHAEVTSHKLMLRAGMVRQECSGIYSWLPLGFRVLTKISHIISQEQNRIGAHEILMPTVQSASLWRKSGRYDEYGKEMLRFQDRHNQDLLFGPTNEEMITDIFANFAQSYKDLPRNMFHIQWKFRDEVRPRFGVMRGREFLMKDGYGFAISEEQHKQIYNKIFISYLRIFARMGVSVVPVRAETGPIGGELSHEFVILADTGESKVFCDSGILDLDIMQEDVDYREDDLQPIVDKWIQFYAATDDMFSRQSWDCIATDKRLLTRGIEVGHIFYFGTKYSETMGLQVEDKHGKRVYVHMGSYGIGVSRVVAGIVESCHDDKGIVWPLSVAPFSVGLINVNADSKKCCDVCEHVFVALQKHNLDVLYDDRKTRVAKKFSEMELIGIPWTIVVGVRYVADNLVELKERKSGKVQTLPFEEVLRILQEKASA